MFDEYNEMKKVLNYILENDMEFLKNIYFILKKIENKLLTIKVKRLDLLVVMIK